MTTQAERVILNKAAKITMLLEKSFLTRLEIADIVGTSKKYVELVDYDVRSNGGVKRASSRYRQAHPRKRVRVPGEGNSKHVNSEKRNWVAQHPEQAQEIQARYYGKTASISAISSKRRWAFREDEFLLADRGRTPDVVLAVRLGRSIIAIQARRTILKKSHFGIIDVRTAISGRNR